jgi:eukaryotic-like serine/threonine-protein kinase
VTQVDEGPESPEAPGVLTVGTPTAGEVLAERYELQEHINDDAFGRQVWRGVDVVLRRPVAVVMRYPGGSAAVEMLDAAVAASRVVHPHLVDVYDAIDEGTRAYVVREWVDGGSLREYVAEGPLDAERATTVTSAIAGAVAAVHATGMAHGNIHPGTVLIGSDGRVVLADARADESATPDTDVRAIGGVLYCALTGYWPHAEAGASQVPDAVRDDDGRLTPPRQVRGGVPGHLSDLATDLLDPEVAPPSADVLAADLSRLEGDREDDLFSVSSPLLGLDQPGYGGMVGERPRSLRKLVVGVAVLLVLAVVGLMAAVDALTSSHPNTPAAAQTGGGSSPSGSSTQPNGKPTQLPLTAEQVRVIDPDAHVSSDKKTGLGPLVDGSPGTAWKSEHYFNQFSDSYMRGLGFLIDLKSEKQVATVSVQMSPGAMVDLRYGTVNPNDDDKTIFGELQAVSQPKSAGAGVTVLNGPQQPVRYLMVWISKLVPDAGQYFVSVSDIQVQVS